MHSFIPFWLRGVSLLRVGFHPLQCGGSSLSWLLLLQSAGSVVVRHGLSCPTACGIFQNQGSNPCPLHRQVNSLPLGSDGKESTCRCRRPRFVPWVGKILWRREWQTTPVFLPGEFHGWRSLVGYSPCGCRESDMTEPLALSL